jgi:hypothetical protein
MPGERHPSQVTITVPGVHQREDIEARAGALFFPAIASTHACRALLRAVQSMPAATNADVVVASEQRLSTLGDIEGADLTLSKLPSFTVLVAAAITGYAYAHARVPLPDDTTALPAPVLAAYK